MIVIAFVIITALSAFIAGMIFKPVVLWFIREYIFDYAASKNKRYEVKFKIEFYSQPSLHHLGEEGVLVKTEPIKAQVDAVDADEALNILDNIIKQEIKAELLELKEIPKL